MCMFSRVQSQIHTHIIDISKANCHQQSIIGFQFYCCFVLIDYKYRMSLQCRPTFAPFAALFDLFDYKSIVECENCDLMKKKQQYS